MRSSTLLSRRGVIEVSCALSLVGVITAGPVHAQAELEKAEALALRQRATVEIERLAAVQRAPRDATPIADAFVDLADTLASAGLDSLAATGLDLAGWVAFRSGDRAAASKRWRRGLELAQRAGSLEVESRLLNSSAVGYASGGDYEKGIDLWKRNVLFKREIGDRLGEGRVWGNLANAYALLGRVPEALVATEVATRLDLETGNRRGLLIGYHRRAGLLADLGQLEEAVAFADSAVAGSRAEGMTGLLVAALPRCAGLNYDLGRTQHALTLVEEAIELARGNGAAKDESQARAIRTQILLAEGRADEALVEAEIVSRQAEQNSDRVLAARILVPRGDALALAGRLDEAEEVLEDALTRYEELRATQADELSQVGLYLNGGQIYSSLGHCYYRQGRVAKAWAAVERGQAGVLRANLGGGIATLGQVQTLLRESGAALVQISEPVGHPMLVFVVTPDTVTATALDADAQSIFAAARAGLDLMSSGADDAACEEALVALAEPMVAAIGARLPEGVERIFWVLPSELTGFPFEALPHPTRLGTLGDTHAISYLPNASSLVLLLGRRSSPQGMVAFADPRPTEAEDGEVAEDADDVLPSPERSLRRRALPAARDEVRAVASRGARVHFGDDATKDRVRGRDVRDSSVLHFATHALVDPSAPQRSSLILAGDDALLSALEVEELDLSAEMVTLSGCRTSGGYTVLGEGTLGLSRAFLVAGSRSVVASLWDVEDQAARRFMEIFYSGLKEGRARDESLRAARQTMAREGYSHRDRSAFILVGIGHLPVAALVEGRALPWTNIALGAVLIALALLAAVRLARRHPPA